MNSIWINAPAKINIGLDVLRRREDGYHEVKMIMQSIRLFVFHVDDITIGIRLQVLFQICPAGQQGCPAFLLTKSDKPGIRLTTNLRFLPVNEDNLVYRSAKLLMDEYKLEGGLDIQLDKRIPVAAGMAGGSADAAGVLARTHYTRSFPCIVRHGNVWGCQFHPEKSSALGQRILKNFVNIVEEAGR